MVELLIELLGEFLLQFFGQLFVELGVHVLSAPFERRANPIAAGIGYALFGAALGGLSLPFFPTYLVPVGPWRGVNLVATRLGVGGLMALLGAWRAKRGDPVFRIDRFAFGFIFALAVALIRFYFAKDA